MNHQIRRLSVVFMIALLVMIANLSVYAVWQAPTLRGRADNTRSLLEEYGRPRGAIMVANREIAFSEKTAGTLAFERRYLLGEQFAPITGFYSLVYGATGLERIYNDILSGRDDRLAVDRLQQLLAGRDPEGGIVTVTINPDLQDAAYRALKGRRGAVVALDPDTGEILALVSSPSYNPQKLSSNRPSEVRDYYAKLKADSDSPLSNRPLTTTLPPGSTFKLVVAAAALESGRFTPDTVIPGPASLKLPLSTKRLHNWQNGPCSSSGKVTLRRALEVSCNTAFAWLGMQLGAEALLAQAERFGFNDGWATPLVPSSSVFPIGLDEAQTAMSSIGQFDVRATALQMAMVTAAISGDGKLYRPWLIKRVTSADYEPIEVFQPELVTSVMSEENAALLWDMMQTTVTNGTASSGKVNGVVVGAKTGTAESGTTALPHAWFVAAAQKDGKRLAVAVVVENGGGEAEVSGNRISGPIANAVIKAAFLTD